MTVGVPISWGLGRSGSAAVRLDRRGPASHQQQGERNTQQRGADPEEHEGESRVDVIDHPGEVHTEEPGDEGEWKEDRRHHRQPVDRLVQTQVDQLGQFVAGGIDPADQANQLLVDALEIVLAIGAQPRDQLDLLAIRSKTPR